MSILKKNSEKWLISDDQVYVMGFSAGGHLAASLGVFWNSGRLAGITGLKPEEMRPAGMILSYPVITSGEKAHRRSIHELLGEKDEDPEFLELVSLEKQVTADTPKTFLWHTLTDETVPVENSLLLAQAMIREGVKLELHIYPLGGHGLALALRETAGDQEKNYVPYCSSWISMAQEWMELNFQCSSMTR